ncbi:MAG: hypothetical protein QME66_05830 [Candidatus Eisenbacteria bacterium]|nr:hypothetical protein [Candidatus Eisenbacteria bacterium]
MSAESIRRLSAGEPALSPREAGSRFGMQAGFELVGGPLAKGAGKLGGKLGRKLLPPLLESFQGVSKEATEFILKKGPKEVLTKLGKFDPEMTDKLILNFKNTLENARRIAGEKLGRIENKLASKFKGVQINAMGVANLGESKLLDRLSTLGGELVIPKAEQEEVVNIIQLIQKNPILSIPDALAFRRNLDAVIDPTSGLAKVSKPAQGILKQMRKQLNEEILTIVPHLRPAGAAFGRVVDNLKRIGTFFESGDVEKKLFGLFKSNTSQRRLFEKASKATNQGGDILDRIFTQFSRKEFKPLLRRVPFGPIALGGLGATALFRPEFIPQAGITLGAIGALSSPRIAASALKTGEAARNLARFLKLRQAAQAATAGGISRFKESK